MSSLIRCHVRDAQLPGDVGRKSVPFSDDVDSLDFLSLDDVGSVEAEACGRAFEVFDRPSTSSAYN